MRRDLVIALVISALLHAGLAFGFASKPPAKLAPPPPPAIEIIALPPSEPEEPPPAREAELPSNEPATVPPMQPDLPSVRLDSPFLQPVQPAPPPGLGRPSGLIAIPSATGNGVGGGFGGIFSLADLDQKPAPLFDAPFVATYQMRLEGLTGEIELSFVIDELGRPRDVSVLRTEHREFEAPAVATVLRSTYSPGKKGGRAVSTRVTRVLEIKPPESP